MFIIMRFFIFVIDVELQVRDTSDDSDFLIMFIGIMKRLLDENRQFII